MRKAASLLVLLLGLVLAVPTPLPGKEDPEKIAKLVTQLGSSDFQEREKATRDLEQIGQPALDALRKAARGDDREVQRRAEELIGKIEKTGAAARLLSPTRVKLNYKDTPIHEAVADLAKQSKIVIALYDPEKKLADRKVTLETGSTTFWQAFDQFCDKAGLIEAASGAPGGQLMQPRLEVLPAAPPRGLLPAKPDVKPVIIDEEVRAGRGYAETLATALIALQAQPPAPPPLRFPPGAPGAGPSFPPDQITLTNGKPKPMPTCYIGAARIRALPGDTRFGKPREGELLLTIQVSLEPKVTWQRLVALRAEKALDDQGQSLAEVMGAGPALPNPNLPPGAVRLGMAARPLGIGLQESKEGLHQFLALRLKKGAKPSKSLKELKGVISAQVHGLAEPFIKVDNILKAPGKVFKGEPSGTLRVVEAGHEDGILTLRVEVEVPGDVIIDGFSPAGLMRVGPMIAPPPPPIPAPPPPPPPPPAPGAGLVQLEVQLGIGRAGPHGGQTGGLELVDDKGRAFAPESFSMIQRMAADAMLHEYRLSYKLDKAQVESAKLALSASRSVTVDMPFILKDVPLE